MVSVKEKLDQRRVPNIDVKSHLVSLDDVKEVEERVMVSVKEKLDQRREDTQRDDQDLDQNRAPVAVEAEGKVKRRKEKAKEGDAFVV